MASQGTDPYTSTWDCTNPGHEPEHEPGPFDATDSFRYRVRLRLFRQYQADGSCKQPEGYTIGSETMKRDEQQARFLELEYFTLWGHGIRMAKKLCDEHGLEVDDATILEQGRLAGAGMVAEQKKDARTKTIEKGKNARTPKRAADAPTACEKCGSADLWDNRQKKATGEYKPKSPDFKCKECEHPVWLDSKKPKTPAGAVAETSDLPF